MHVLFCGASIKGTIMNPGPRRSMPALVYIRGILFVPEFVWACLGAVWVSNYSTGCEPAEIRLVAGAVIARWVKADHIITYKMKSIL